jgi:ankyrin repeat protein
LALGYDVNKSEASGMTPLMAAAGNPKIEIARTLILVGADVDVRDNAGRTALMLAAGLNPGKLIVRALVNAGADPSIKDHSGRDAAAWAEFNDNPEVAEFFKPVTANRPPSDADSLSEAGSVAAPTENVSSVGEEVVQ